MVAHPGTTTAFFNVIFGESLPQDLIECSCGAGIRAQVYSSQRLHLAPGLVTRIMNTSQVGFPFPPCQLLEDTLQLSPHILSTNFY